jgi:DNA polymerase-3 subunit beta
MAADWPCSTSKLEFPRSHEADIIVPTKAVTELQRLLSDDGEVKVSVVAARLRLI